MKITAITCTHNRPEAFALAERWMSRQTLKPTQWLVLDDSDTKVTCTAGQEHHYWPELRGKDSMVNKMLRAIERGLVTGDYIIIWEDDDWYAPDYIEWCVNSLKRFDLVGEAHNLYYNVRHRWWFDHHNGTHASLCATSLRKSVLTTLLRVCKETAKLPEKERPFIDDRLWKQCRLPKMPFDPKDKRRSIGIKAMPGIKGYGSGHDKDSGWAIRDPRGAKLHALIGDDAEEYAKFYESQEAATLIQPDGLPKVEVHLVAFNEEEILPYTLRHYQTYAHRIIVHDGGSTDRTREICKQAGATVLDWDTDGKINDILLRELKESAWKGTDADWVIMADADELMYFVHGAINTLPAYDKMGVCVVKPRGIEMLAEKYPTTDQQIYDEVKMGAYDDRWYAKPIMFSPKRVTEMHYTEGAHECSAVLRGGLKMVNPVRFSDPPAYLLHFHHLGPVERIGARYDGNKSRFSEENKKHGWGWSGDGLKHAMDKRAAIAKGLFQVIP